MEKFSEHLMRCGELASRRFDAEMFVRESGGDAPALRAVEQTKLHQVRFVNFLDGVFFFAKRGGDGVQSDGPAGIFFDDGHHQVAIHFVEAVLVHAEHLQALRAPCRP